MGVIIHHERVHLGGIMREGGRNVNYKDGWKHATNAMLDATREVQM